MLPFASVAAVLLILAGSAGYGDPEMNQRPRRSTDLPRPRDPDIAVREELEIARRAGTVGAFDLFLARHPDHPLAKVAREERQVLARRRD